MAWLLNSRVYEENRMLFDTLFRKSEDGYCPPEIHRGGWPPSCRPEGEIIPVGVRYYGGGFYWYILDVDGRHVWEAWETDHDVMGTIPNAISDGRGVNATRYPLTSERKALMDKLRKENTTRQRRSEAAKKAAAARR